MITFRTVDALSADVGRNLGASEWHQVGQPMINSFAELTGDRQWIHLAEPASYHGPFAGPVAHGMLTLALLVPMLPEIFQVDGVDVVVHKGLDRVRFVSPVPAGARVRTEAVLRSVTARPHDYTEVVLSTRIVVAGGRRPACRADCTILYHRAG
jgi:acyl dehydratase